MRRAAALVLAGAIAFSACGGDGEAKVQPYDHAPVPAVPDHTHEVVATGTLPDGDYWATASGADTVGATVAFTVTQAFFGPACTAALGADRCDGDMGVLSEPTVTLTASAATFMSISVAAANRQNYAVPAAELVALVAGDSPGERSPADFQYEQYPFMVTVEGGIVTEAHQIWMP